MDWVVNPNIVVCKDCSAECCKHIAAPLEEPKTWEECEAIKWYIAHENVCVYKDVEGDWLVEFISKCGQLDGHRCKAWGTKDYPQICGEYKMETCVMNEEGEYWEILFKTAADVDQYMQEKGISKPEHPKPNPYPTCVCVPLDPPENLEDWDTFRWYIAHHDVRVYETKGNWYLHLNTLCRRRDGHIICPIRNNHIPKEGRVFATWEDIARECDRLGLVQKPTLTLTETL
jgi:hypothetical protein